jgi:integrase
MAYVAAYAGLRQGELFALTIAQVDPAARVITVDRKLVEVAGHLYVEAPKCRKFRAAIYPVRTPQGYPLAGKLAARAEQARAEQQAGLNPLGLVFPSPRFRHWRSSNFDRRVLAPAYQAAGWRDEHADVSRMAGHANYRITLDMYVGTTKGVLDRARQATQ